jgi:hypothetical protein
MVIFRIELIELSIYHRVTMTTWHPCRYAAPEFSGRANPNLAVHVLQAGGLARIQRRFSCRSFQPQLDGMNIHKLLVGVYLKI